MIFHIHKGIKVYVAVKMDVRSVNKPVSINEVQADQSVLDSPVPAVLLNKIVSKEEARVETAHVPVGFAPFIASYFSQYMIEKSDDIPP